MPHPTIISVVSGKGGTGKSLSCALLGRLLAQESAKVLLVDFDIFVRGLTYLFYLYTKERRILTKGPAVVDLLAASRSTPNETIVPEQFFEIYIVPAVREIEQVVEYDYLPAFGRKLREHTSLQGSDDPIMVFLISCVA